VLPTGLPGLPSFSTHPFRFVSGSTRLRVGSYATERELAEAARAALEASGLSHGDAAEALGLQRAAVSMALNLEKYPVRGHSVRRSILRRFAGLDVGEPRYRIEKAAPGGADGV
jgi:hypothetical protein